MRKEYFILPEDRIWLDTRIAELEQEIQALGPEFYDVFNQSSETWHDNAPFDALRERQDVLNAELSKLKQIRFASLPSIPKSKKDIVGVGSRVTLSTGRTLTLAGHWTHRAGHAHDDTTIVSIESPIGTAIFGKKLNSETPFGKIINIK